MIMKAATATKHNNTQIRSSDGLCSRSRNLAPGCTRNIATSAVTNSETIRVKSVRSASTSTSQPLHTGSRATYVRVGTGCETCGVTGSTGKASGRADCGSAGSLDAADGCGLSEDDNDESFSVVRPGARCR